MKRFVEISCVLGVVALAGGAAHGQQVVSTGTGVIINAQGDVATNAHVVTRDDPQPHLCPGLLIRRDDDETFGRVVAIDPLHDIAVVRMLEPEALLSGAAAPPTSIGGSASTTSVVGARPSSGGGLTAITGERSGSSSSTTAASRSGGSFAVFRAEPVASGESIYVVGYPLASTLSDQAKIVGGMVSSTTGEFGDISQFQTTAPINPGNSGGPVMDASGNLIGLAVAKYARVDVEGVTFSIKPDTVQAFFRDNGIEYHVGARGGELNAPGIFAHAQPFTVLVGCLD